MSGRPREFNDDGVLDAAMEVFWEKGYEACSTEDLCQRTGLGRGSLYNAFGSKQALYALVLQRYHDLGIQAQMQILSQPGKVKPRLRQLLESATESELACAQRRGCMAVNAVVERGGKDDMVTRAFAQHVVRLEQALCHALAVGQRSGEISTARPPLEQARVLLNSFYGLRVLAKVVADDSVLADIVEGSLAAL